MEKKSHFKDIIIFVLCILMVIMGIGYAVVARDLVLRGVTKISSKLNVVITAIDVTDNKTEGTKNISSYIESSVSAAFETRLSKPGDYIEYVVTIKNKGNKDAKLSYATLNPESSQYIEFERYGEAIDNPILKVGETTTIKIKVKFKNVGNLPSIFEHIARTELLLGYVEYIK